jgi:hypothetical protein
LKFNVMLGFIIYLAAIVILVQMFLEMRSGWRGPLCSLLHVLAAMTGLPAIWCLGEAWFANQPQIALPLLLISFALSVSASLLILAARRLALSTCTSADTTPAT